MSLSIFNEPRTCCTLCQEVAFTLHWRPEQDFPAGTQVELRGGPLRAFLSWRHVASRMADGDITFRWKIKPTVSEMWRNANHVILRAKLPYGARCGRDYPLELTCIPPIWAGVDEQLSVWTIGPGDAGKPNAPLLPAIREDGSTCLLRAVAGPVERLSIYLRPVAAGGRVEAVIVPQDRFGNPARFVRPLPARVHWMDQIRAVEVQGTTTLALPRSDRVARAEVRIPTQALATDENIGNGTWQESWCCITSNVALPAPVNGLRPVFGEIHWHTELSGDGQRPIAEALRSARDELLLEFAAPSDHNPSPEAWRQTVAALEQANESGRFVTFFGWELSSDQGHENYYFTDPNHPLICGGSAGVTAGRPVDQIDKLNLQRDFLAVPHHTNAVSESRRLEDDAPFWHPYPWTTPTAGHRLAEICQSRGNQERDEYSDVWRGWHQHHGASVQDALAKGYRLGFTGGTDNHCGWPGRFDPEEAFGMVPPASQILTGVWTEALDRTSLFQALWARHTWAAWDSRAVVWFTLNGALMGDELRVAPGTALTAHIRIHAEAPFQIIEVVSGGKVFWNGGTDSPDFEASLELGNAEKPAYFYVRALLRNGGILYASPVFIDTRG
ncbi:MAG: DUF3604 domain-containing protein [Planctomycetes bacterium]|nr:DUF3604 domain-containing protein [Planctomycetota bacterium]